MLLFVGTRIVLIVQGLQRSAQSVKWVVIVGVLEGEYVVGSKQGCREGSAKGEVIAGEK